MRFVRYGEKGAEKPGVLDESGQLRDLSGQIADLGGDVLSDLAALNADGPVVTGNPRLGMPIARPGKVVCIGRNYKEHASEMGGEVPEEPLIFMKATSSLQGPNDPVIYPKGGQSVDYEIELAVVIGKAAKHVSEAEALSHVAGYMTFNDMTERVFQKQRGGQWTKGKSCDTFGPMGPYLVTADELGDPQALDLRLSVNGDLRQSSNTGMMIFSVAALIAHLSEFFTLEVGDVIATGTPAGVAAGMKPPQFLQVGDEVSCSVGPLGEQRFQIVTG